MNNTTEKKFSVTQDEDGKVLAVRDPFGNPLPFFIRPAHEDPDYEEPRG